MTENKKTVNPLLIGVVGIAAFWVCNFVITYFVVCIGYVTGYAILNRINNVVFLTVLIALTILSLLRKNAKIIHTVAMGLELLAIIAGITFPQFIAQIVWPKDVLMEQAREIFDGSIIRTTALYMLIGLAVAIILYRRVKNKGIIAYLVLLAAALAVTIGVSYILVFGISPFPAFGARGSVFGFFQPFCIFPYAAALGEKSIRSLFTRSTGGKTPTYSYLEQYKQEMKNGGNKNV